MNEYLNYFQSIIAPDKDWFLNELTPSRELRSSIDELGISIDPCIAELKASAVRLKELMQPCFSDLYQALEVWDSKPRISEVPSSDLWLQLGEIVGLHARFKLFIDKNKAAVLSQAKGSWEKRVHGFIEKYFQDSNNQVKKGIGWSEKESFLKKVPLEIAAQSEELNKLILASLKLVFQDMSSLPMDKIYLLIRQFDANRSQSLETHIGGLFDDVNAKFSDARLSCSHTNFVELPVVFQTTIESWRRCWGDIAVEDVLNLKDDVSSKMEARIDAVFNDRKDSALQLLDSLINLYDDFLDRKNRYLQETPESRAAEKIWIDQQLQKLEDMQTKFNQLIEAEIKTIGEEIKR